MLSISPLQVEGFFDRASATVSYLVLDRDTGCCALIDSLLDPGAHRGGHSSAVAERLVERVQELGARVQWLLETDVHADHRSAAPMLQQTLGGRIGIGRPVVAVRQLCGQPCVDCGDGSGEEPAFDHLFDDGERFDIGGLQGRVLHTPGHTPASTTYVVADGEGPVAQIAAFVGDTLCMPEQGTAACDFPGGDARTLFASVNKVLSLPAATRVYIGHGHAAGGRGLRFVSTVAEQRSHNVHVRNGISEEAFVALRQAGDTASGRPVPLLSCVRANLRCGLWSPT